MRRKSKEEKAKIRSHIDPFYVELAWQPPKKAIEIGFATWDKPQWVPAGAAEHLRDDDYVLGIRHENTPYCMPIYIIDYYHVINAVIEGDPVYFSS